MKISEEAEKKNQIGKFSSNRKRAKNKIKKSILQEWEMKNENHSSFPHFLFR